MLQRPKIETAPLPAPSLVPHQTQVDRPASTGPGASAPVWRPLWRCWPLGVDFLRKPHEDIGERSAVDVVAGGALMTASLQ